MSDSVMHSLEEEIRYLRSLLDENGISYDFEAFRRRKDDVVELSQMVPIEQNADSPLSAIFVE